MTPLPTSKIIGLLLSLLFALIMVNSNFCSLGDDQKATTAIRRGDKPKWAIVALVKGGDMRLNRRNELIAKAIQDHSMHLDNDITGILHHYLPMYR